MLFRSLAAAAATQADIAAMAADINHTYVDAWDEAISPSSTATPTAGV